MVSTSLLQAGPGAWNHLSIQPQACDLLTPPDPVSVVNIDDRAHQVVPFLALLPEDIQRSPGGVLKTGPKEWTQRENSLTSCAGDKSLSPPLTSSHHTTHQGQND